MVQIEKLLTKMDRAPNSVRFTDLAKVCDQYFGQPRQQSTSDRVNIQNHNGKAKPYQVRQALAAIKKLEGEKPCQT